MPTMAQAPDDHDPLSFAIAPPPNETSEARDRRIRAEMESKRRSDRIDEAIERARLEEKKRKKATKVLLLGQSGAGKSTVLKNLQIMYAPERFDTQRKAWKQIVLFNIARSVATILEILAEEIKDSEARSPVAASKDEDEESEAPKTTDYTPLKRLHMQLSPLRGIEETIRLRLLTAAEREATQPFALESDNNFTKDSAQDTTLTYMEALTLENGNSSSSSPSSDEGHGTSANEPGLQTLTMMPPPAVPTGLYGAPIIKRESVQSLRPTSSHSQTVRRLGSHQNFVAEEVVDLLRACKDDINVLWASPHVHSLLARRKVRVQDMGGFFLEDIDRIMKPSYLPTDDDILRARVRTTSVQEHRFQLPDPLGEFRVYDVGGARSKRAAWQPFFQDVNGIIFLVPISAFDQTLEEDPSVNRVIDSTQAFKAVCKSQLLRDVSIVLFLNKCDELVNKLAAGKRIGDYLQRQSGRELLNTPNAVQDYFKKMFSSIHIKHPGGNRSLHVHFTSVTNLRATKSLIGGVMDLLIRQSLQNVAAL